jgi:hypothetical protein
VSSGVGVDTCAANGDNLSLDGDRQDPMPA